MDPQILSPPVGPPSGIWILDFHAIRSHLTSLELTLDAALHQVRCCSFCRHSGFRILDLRVLGHFSLSGKVPPAPPLPQGLGSWILDLQAKTYQRRQVFLQIQNPGSRIQDPGPSESGSARSPETQLYNTYSHLAAFLAKLELFSDIAAILEAKMMVGAAVG